MNRNKRKGDKCRFCGVPLQSVTQRCTKMRVAFLNMRMPVSFQQDKRKLSKICLPCTLYLPSFQLLCIVIHLILLTLIWHWWHNPFENRKIRQKGLHAQGYECQSQYLNPDLSASKICFPPRRHTHLPIMLLNS